MNVAPLLLPVLLMTAALGCLRTLRHARNAHRTGGARPASWRTLLLVLLQLAAATLLYFTLRPPLQRLPALPLTVFSAGATASAARNAVALPEAPANITTPRVPDLASALRQHPGSTRIEVLGQGLPARDLDAARGLDVRFTPTPLPRGVVALEAPLWVAAGQTWIVQGRVEGIPAGAVSLHDPSGDTVARVALAADGGFTLHASARSSGLAEFGLQVTDAAKQPVEQIPVPLASVPGDRVRVALLAGGINAELKYLRRWAVDAGLEVGSRLSVSPGVELQAQPVALDAAALKTWDLLIVDDRAWAAMSASERNAVVAAVRDGLGLLLRFTAEPGARERRLLAPLGFALNAADVSRAVRLPALVPVSANASTDAAVSPKMPELSRRALQADAPDALPLLRDAAGEPLAQWRALGRGRVGLWWLTDSYRLVLGGYPARHADLWSRALSQLARPRGRAAPRFQPTQAWVGERITICVAGAAQVTTATGETLALIADPASGDRCAGYWPQQAGWHQLRSGGEPWPFYVRASEQALALHAAQRQHATHVLAARAQVPVGAGSAMQPVARWKLFLAWLLFTSALWVLERSRRGIVGH